MTKPESVPVERIVAYSRCSEMYRLLHVEEVPTPVRVGECFAGALWAVLKRVLADGIELQEACELYEADYGERVLGADITSSTHLNVFLEVGRKFLAAFIMVERISIGVCKVDVPLDAELPRYSGVEPMRVSCTVPIMETSLLTWLRPRRNRYWFRLAYNDLEAMLGAVLTGYSNISTMTFSLRTGTIQRWRITLDAGRKCWAARLAYDMRKGVQRGDFRRCDPDSWVCQQAVCLCWRHCRGKVERRRR